MSDASWRELALQFDNQRMQALSHIRMLLADYEKHKEVAEAFLAEPPLPGKQGAPTQDKPTEWYQGITEKHFDLAVAKAVNCKYADLIAERDRFRQAYTEWSDKTEWVQTTAAPQELGKHRADVLRERIEALHKQLTEAPIAGWLLRNVANQTLVHASAEATPAATFDSAYLAAAEANIPDPKSFVNSRYEVIPFYLNNVVIAKLSDEQKRAMWTNATIELPSPENCYLRGIADAERAYGFVTVQPVMSMSVRQDAQCPSAPLSPRVYLTENTLLFWRELSCTNPAELASCIDATLQQPRI